MKRSTASAFLLGAALVALAAQIALAQGSGLQGESTPLFRAGTTLVEFTVVATDQKGEPVVDLAPGDITIVQNGKPQPVAFFRFEGAAFAPGAVEPKPDCARHFHQPL
jgi:hypothetical protein